MSDGGRCISRGSDSVQTILLLAFAIIKASKIVLCQNSSVCGKCKGFQWGLMLGCSHKKDEHKCYCEVEILQWNLGSSPFAGSHARHNK